LSIIWQDKVIVAGTLMRLQARTLSDFLFLLNPAD
jgi:hypothetical protein